MTKKTSDQTSAWHTMDRQTCIETLASNGKEGLSAHEAAQRLQKYGSNQLAEGKKEPRWQAFLRQYRDFMQLILLGTAVVSFLIGDISSAVMLVVLTLFNAVIGLRQEAKAEDSLAALKSLMQVNARVRRDGDVVNVPVEEIVPGDVVIFEAGDRVPADGRLLLAATLEIEEAALTGESAPVLKDAELVNENADTPIGDRLNMAYMQSTITRGSGEMLVTATGMDTEVGQIADMLQKTKIEKSPLTKQLDDLVLIIAGLAGLALVCIVVIGLAQGNSLLELFNVGVALAVAAIPTGMPIVVTSLLSVGVTELAKHHAIVKRLPAVETLGSTSAICSDKTGTLTLNQMTARKLFIDGHSFKIMGEGYVPDGKILHIGGTSPATLDPVLLPMALCSDATVQAGELVGDPTEGALVTLAEKGGLDVAATRSAYPRIAAVPFDSEYKFMATFHRMRNAAGEDDVRCYVKGAPDVIIDLSTKFRNQNGGDATITESMRQQILDGNQQLAGEGLRVLVVAQKDFDSQNFDLDLDDYFPLVEDLTLLAMVGIVDPPRPEAKAAIAECKRAGIQVRMITGDHAATAATIGRELGIEGRAISGAEFAQMSDAELEAQIDDIGVIARVAPEHKVRLVKTLHKKGNIVAMTGDGVNDAPALKSADIGVAMGIAGTEVSKEAATMILTDDNFSTIVTAIEHGRAIYDNMMKYIRFQMAVLVGFILAFLGSALFDIAGTALFTPVQILWINFIIDAPMGGALGFDTPSPGLMDKKPRPANQKIMYPRLTVRLTILGLFIAIITLGTYQYANQTWGSELIARTMALITFSLSHIFVALNLRYPDKTIFQMETLSNTRLLFTFAWVFIISVLVTEIGMLQNILGTTSLTSQQWIICMAAAVFVVVGGEIAKFVRVRRN